jgi:hypothetical protein
MENALNPQAAFYRVARLNSQLVLDGNWDKPAWRQVEPLTLTHWMGPYPSFRPAVQAKVLYDNEALYVIFRVEDHYVRAVATETNGRVWEDSCVEFFFSPDLNKPMAYFNLEVNAGGVALFHYKDPNNPGAGLPSVESIATIQRYGSLAKVIDPEITKPLIWTMEYRLPLSVLRPFSNFAQPAAGVRWHANFYKCADKTSNPHWITWSKVEHPVPQFHLPQFFGVIEFT